MEFVGGGTSKPPSGKKRQSTGLCLKASIWKERVSFSKRRGLRGASSASGKGHEEGGLVYAKAGSSLRSLPGNSRASTPKTRVCLLSALCFHLHL